MAPHSCMPPRADCSSRPGVPARSAGAFASAGQGSPSCAPGAYLRGAAERRHCALPHRRARGARGRRRPPMNGYQRLSAVFAGERPDHVPVILHNFMMAAREAGHVFSEWRTGPGEDRRELHPGGGDLRLRRGDVRPRHRHPRRRPRGAGGAAGGRTRPVPRGLPPGPGRRSTTWSRSTSGRIPACRCGSRRSGSSWRTSETRSSSAATATRPPSRWPA